MYTLQKVINPTQLPSYSEKISPLLDSNLPVYPDYDSGIWLIKNEKNEEMLFLATRHFNGIMHKISHYVQNNKSKQVTLNDIITFLKKDMSLYPDQSNLTYSEFEDKLKKEYLFITSQDKNILVTLFDEHDNNYIKNGMLHFLFYHYSNFKNSFAKKKVKTLFKEPSTINDLLRFLVIIIDSDDTDSENQGEREVLECSIDSEKYRLILEPFKNKLTKVVSFYRCENN
jgi:hypothetical protein